MEHPHEGHEAPPSFWTTRYAIGLLVIGGVPARRFGYRESCRQVRQGNASVGARYCTS